jgi:hypothetical protein
VAAHIGEVTISKELHPLVRKRLTEVVQLLHPYVRLAELGIAAEERSRTGDVRLSKDLHEHIRGWAEVEDRKIRKQEELTGELVPTIKNPRQ